MMNRIEEAALELMTRLAEQRLFVPGIEVRLPRPLFERVVNEALTKNGNAFAAVRLRPEDMTSLMVNTPLGSVRVSLAE